MTRARILLVAPSPPPYGGMALQAGKLRALLEKDGHDVVFFPSNFSLSGFWSGLPGLRTLRRAIAIFGKLWRECGGVDIVHVLAASWLYFFVVVWPAVLVGRMRGKTIVLNYRGGEAGRFFRWFGPLAAPAFHLATTVTAPSTFLANLISKKFGVPVRIVPNLLDHTAFRYRRRSTFQPKMVIARHLEKMYDIETALRAFRSVQQRYANATLRIAGAGPEESRLRGLVEEWKLGQNVRFLGYVAHADLPAIYDECDILVNASRVDNFPGALIEASAAGLVIVSTAAGGIPHIYEHEKNALLVEPGNPEQLAAQILRSIEAPALAARLAAEGVAVARSCDWSHVRRQLYDVYGMMQPDGAARAPAI